MSSDLTDSLSEDSARLTHEPRLSSQRFDSARYESFADNADGESTTDVGFEEDFSPSIGVNSVDPPTPSDGGEFADNETNFPSPAAEGFALREWRSQNAIRLEVKEKREKEMVKEIIAEADQYKEEYYRKWNVRLENSKAVNREKEKLFLESREKFHAEADKSYWKAVAEIVPKEVPTIEKKGKKKEKTASIVVIQGPKPGKPTDLSRMRQVLVKLKHKPPPHMTSLNAHTAAVSK